jgi:hypothetical protein
MKLIVGIFLVGLIAAGCTTEYSESGTGNSELDACYRTAKQWHEENHPRDKKDLDDALDTCDRLYRR